MVSIINRGLTSYIQDKIPASNIALWATNNVLFQSNFLKCIFTALAIFGTHTGLSLLVLVDTPITSNLVSLIYSSVVNLDNEKDLS